MTIPDAAIEAAATRLYARDYAHKRVAMAEWNALPEGTREYHRLGARAAVEAAMPAIREVIAQEIEANSGGWPIPDHLTPNQHHWNGMSDAARIVRGGTA